MGKKWYWEQKNVVTLASINVMKRRFMNSDGQQFNQYQQKKPITSHLKSLNTLTTMACANGNPSPGWDRHKNVAVLKWLIGYQPLPLLNVILNYILCYNLYFTSKSSWISLMAFQSWKKNPLNHWMIIAYSYIMLQMFQCQLDYTVYMCNE